MCDLTRLIIVMGVCGAGKSSIASRLANYFGAAYIEGDDYHPAENVARMRSGDKLIDAHRWPWLRAFTTALKTTPGMAVGSCSALKKGYRDYIRQIAGETVLFIHLDGSRELVSRRMQSRDGHFMPVSLLDSQLAMLEIPDESELAVSVDISGSEQEIVNLILEKLRPASRASPDTIIQS